jgi:hypothetical protein
MHLSNSISLFSKIRISFISILIVTISLILSPILGVPVSFGHKIDHINDKPTVVWADEKEVLIKASAYLTSARVDPLCIRAGIDTFRLMIGVIDPAVTHVKMDTKNLLTYLGSPVSLIELYDDGTHGDQVAGDNIFTLDQISLTSMPSTVGKTIFRYTDVTLVYPDTHEATYNEDLALTLRYIDTTVPLPVVTAVAVDIQKTDYAVAIVQTLGGSFPGHTVNAISVCNRYYDFFPDDRDFLLLAKPFNTAGFPAASFGTIRNDVEGIGLSLYDSSDFYGSSGILQGLMYIYFGNVWGTTLTHEFLHRWAVFLDTSLDLGQSHWGAVQRSSTGFGGPEGYSGVFDHIEHYSGNIYRCWLDNNQNELNYNDLELYLMGLVGLADVASPIRTLVNPVWQQYLYEEGIRYSIYTADGIRDVSTAEIVAAEGVRSPDYLSSQNNFSSSLIVVYDRPLSDVELAYYDYPMREYEMASSSFHAVTFEEATGGLAAMSTLVPSATCVGDTNVDYDVDGLDLSNFIYAYTRGDIDADLNRDGSVNWQDVQIVASKLGKNDC